MMKELKTLMTLLVVTLAAAAALALMAAAWSAVRGHHEYEMLVAPRSLHQMVLEMDADESRSSTWLFGAGLMAAVVVVFGGMILSMRGGAELLRQWRLSRKRNSRPVVGAQPARQVQHAPLLGEGGKDETDVRVMDNSR